MRQNIGRASCNFQFKGITMELLSNHYINKERSPFFQLGQHTFGLSFLHPFFWVRVCFQPWLLISTQNYIFKPESYFIPESGFQPWIRVTIKLLSNYYIHKEKIPLPYSRSFGSEKIDETKQMFNFEMIKLTKHQFCHIAKCQMAFFQSKCRFYHWKI